MASAMDTVDGLLLERIETLEKQMAAHTSLAEALIFIMATDEEVASDEVKREVFKNIMVGAKQKILMADLEQVTAESAEDVHGAQVRELLRRVREG
jgi:hypothetical protein